MSIRIQGLLDNLFPNKSDRCKNSGLYYNFSRVNIEMLQFETTYLLTVKISINNHFLGISSFSFEFISITEIGPSALGLANICESLLGRTLSIKFKTGDALPKLFALFTFVFMVHGPVDLKLY